MKDTENIINGNLVAEYDEFFLHNQEMEEIADVSDKEVEE